MDDDVQPAVSRPAHGRSSKQEKVCHNCGTTRTPLWRKEGGSHLCNACGIYLKARGTHRPVELIRAQMILSARRGTGPDGGTGNDGGGGGSRARAVANQITRKSARKRTLRPGEGADDDDNYVSAKTARVATHARRPHLPPHASDAASTLMRNRLLAYSLAMGYTGNGGGATVGGGAGGHGPMLMPLHGTALAADGGLHGGAGHRGFGGGGAGGNGGLARLHALHAAQQRFNAGGGMFGGGGGFAGALAEEHNAALARYYGGGDGGEVGDGGDGSQDDEFMAYNGEGLQRGLYAGDGLPGGYGSGQTEEDEEEEEEEEDALIDGSVGGVDGMNPELSTCPELKADDDACAVASFLLMMRAGPSRGRKAAANAAAPQQQLVPLQLVPQREDAAVHQSLEAAVAAAQRAAGGMQLGGEHEDGSLPTDLAPGTPAAAGAAEVTAVVLEGNAAPAEAAAGDAAVKVQEEQTLAKPVSESEPGQPTSSTGTARPQPLTVQPTTSSQDGPDCVRLPQLVLAAAGSESPLVQSGADGAAEELAAAAMAAAAARSDVTKASPTGSDACDENVLGSLAPAVGAAAAAAAAAGDSDEAEERPADELLATMAPVGYRARNLDPASLQVRGEPTREHVVAPLVIPPPRPQHGAAGSRDRASMQVQVVAAADFSAASAGLPLGVGAAALLGTDALRGLAGRGLSPQLALAALQQQHALENQHLQQQLQLAAAAAAGLGQGQQLGAGAQAAGSHVPKVNPNSVSATASRHAATIAAGGCPPPPPRPPRNHRGPLLCSNCGTTQTPLWRKDRETGVTMCNACGIYKQTHGFDRPIGRNQAGGGAAAAVTKRGSGGGARGSVPPAAGKPDLATAAAVAAAAAMASERAAGVPICSWTAVGTLNPPSASGSHLGGGDHSGWAGSAGGNEALGGGKVKGRGSRAASPSPAAAGVLGSGGCSVERSASPRSGSVPNSNGRGAGEDGDDQTATTAGAAGAAAAGAKRPHDGTEQQQLQLLMLLEKERARGRRMDGTFSSWVMQTGPALASGGARRAVAPAAAAPRSPGGADAGSNGKEAAASPTTLDGIPVIKPINAARQGQQPPQAAAGSGHQSAAAAASRSPASPSASPSPSPQQPQQPSGAAAGTAAATTADGSDAGRGAQAAQGVRIHARPLQVQGQQMSALRAAGVTLGPRMAQPRADAAEVEADEAGAGPADAARMDGAEADAERVKPKLDAAAAAAVPMKEETMQDAGAEKPRPGSALQSRELQVQQQQRSAMPLQRLERDGPSSGAGGVVLRELLAGGFGGGGGGSPLAAAALQQQHELQRMELRAALAAADAGDMSRVALMLHQQQQQRSQAALALMQQQDQFALALAARQAGYLGAFGDGPAMGRGGGGLGGVGGGRGMSLDTAALLMASAAGNGGGGGGLRQSLGAGGGGLGGLSAAQQQQLLALHLRDTAAAGGLMQGGGRRGLDRL